MILRDNVYGTIDDDALRRDFTINALYYTPADFAIYDFANGLRDLEARQIRLIGDPEHRYREDPVRMLRALRFAAKLTSTWPRRPTPPSPRCASALWMCPQLAFSMKWASYFFTATAKKASRSCVTTAFLACYSRRRRKLSRSSPRPWPWRKPP